VPILLLRNCFHRQHRVRIIDETLRQVLQQLPGDSRWAFSALLKLSCA